MCSNKTLNCLFNKNNSSVLSEAYDFSTKSLKIFFKQKFKLCTGIDNKTTFNDLKLALLFSLYSKSKNSKSNLEYIKRKADNYVICESLNTVEKVIDSSILVINEINRISQESLLLGDLKVVHVMRSRKRLMPLPFLISSKNEQKEEEKIPILREFYIEENNNNEKQKECTTTSIMIDEQLENFEIFIQERKNYINLLEEYLKLLETFDITDLPKKRLETFV